MKRYPKEVKDFITENVEGTTTKDLIKLVNDKFGTDFTESKMKSYKANYNLKSGTPIGKPAGRSTGLYSEEVIRFITQNHSGIGPKDMSELLNKTFNTNYTNAQMKSYYGNHHINSGKKGYFEKGHTPANKGQKGYCAPGCEKSWFQKGHNPVNHKPVGSERVDNKDGYTLVKIAEPNVWKLKQHVVWEDANGPIPKGHIVTFLDGNKGNFTLDNLSLITMAESLQLTRLRLRSNNPEFTRTGILIAKLKIMHNKKKLRSKAR